MGGGRDQALGGRDRGDSLVILMMIIAALAIPLINPVGYVGGGHDDSHYLDAARCWMNSGGFCLPEDHWQSRWPAIAPMALIISMFGESRWTVSLAAYLPWLACVVLIAALVRTWFDRRIAALAALLFASTPIVASLAFQPGVDIVELAFQLAALWLASLAWSCQSKPLAIAAGAFAALAVQARDTSILFCGAAAFAWLLLYGDRRRVLLWTIAGFAAVLLLEPLAYALTTGDFLYRYRLSLGHVAIPSEELAAGVDTSRSPFFNAELIAGWRRDGGIAVWWPIDPWLNLLASPRCGLLLSSVLIFAAIGWRTLPAAALRIVGRAAAMALLVAAGLIYGLAVDPKPRMMLLPIAAAAMTGAVLTVTYLRSGRGMVPAAAMALVVLGGVWILASLPNGRAFEDRAAAWIVAHPGQVAVQEKTRSVLALVEGARTLPGSESGRPLVIAATNGDCRTFGYRVADWIGERDGSRLCLIDRRARPGS